jgi:hypothetical protein
MRITKFLIIAFAVTLLAVLYVYQQSKIIHLAYQGQERLALLESSVDKNSNLRYNINRQMSLVSIAGLWEEGDFEWPHQKQLVSLSTTRQTPEDNRQIKETENIFTRLLGLRSQAEATLIKPQ